MKVLVSSAMGLAPARTGKRGAAGGDLARGHLGGGGDGEVGGDDSGHFCCCVVCVRREACASMTLRMRSTRVSCGFSPPMRNEDECQMDVRRKSVIYVRSSHKKPIYDNVTLRTIRVALDASFELRRATCEEFFAKTLAFFKEFCDIL